MKRLLGLTLSLASICFVASPAEAKAAEPSAAPASPAAASTAAPQWRRGGYNRRARVYTTTRLVRVGWRLFRETYRVRILPNGRTQATLISRVRVR